MECLQSCWAQEYTKRPTAKAIEKIFKASSLVTYKNSYETKYAKVSAALVTKIDKVDITEEMIWIATTTDEENTLVSYNFSPQDCFIIAKPKNKFAHPRLSKMVGNDLL